MIGYFISFFEMYRHLWPLILLAFPFVGFLLNGAFVLQGRRTGGGVLASSVMGLSFVLALVMIIFLQDKEAFQTYSFTWLDLSNFTILFSLSFDHLSSTMVVMITGISFLIHIYSIGYMKGDPSERRYFSYLNLFCFFMLLLVMSSNLILMFFGWEGVGLCSYLLIGFWYEDPLKTIHGMKAFILNRIGDVGFLLGMILLNKELHTLDIEILKNTVGQLSSSKATLISLLLFMGPIGKSAQWPLYTWLPDAMSGPTPVSALIHAATMVTAGVYFILRLFFLYQLSPLTWEVILTIGTIGAVLGGLVALSQTDIKKVLAYSTFSQLGLMFMALGCGAYEAALFHLLTHACFKALLFLGAGSVIHAHDGEQDMRKMGGARKRLPHTFITMLIGALGLAGVPPLCGFFSKDEILIGLFHSEHYVFFCLAILTSFLTAIYSIRLLSMVFLGRSRSPSLSLHESPKVMTFPLYKLAILTLLAGAINFPLPSYRFLSHFLSFPLKEDILHEEFIMSLSAVVSLCGVLVAFYLFRERFTFWPKKIDSFFEKECFVHPFYKGVIYTPLRVLTLFLAKKGEEQVIPFIEKRPGIFLEKLFLPLRRFQNGDIQRYLFLMAMGLLVVVFFLTNFSY